MWFENLYLQYLLQSLFVLVLSQTFKDKTKALTLVAKEINNCSCILYFLTAMFRCHARHDLDLPREVVVAVRPKSSNDWSTIAANL